jgi:hypothetical protein
MPRRIEVIDNRIIRLQALMKRLRAERRLAVLREKHREVKFSNRETTECLNLKM